jgi:DNA-binding LacI/PurR family transcriptional regulator
VLKWFAEQEAPVIAKFGRFMSLPIAGAGVRKIPAMREVVRRLHGLGHRRIVMVAREERRKPNPGALERAFLEELEQLGIRTGGYNLPDWENNAADFHRCLDSLFRHTPPTALLLSEARLYVAAQQHLAALGLIAPRDVSLVCDDPDTAFAWCSPAVSHIRWDSRPVVNRIMRWVDCVARGQEDKKQWFASAEFVEGGTIGPAPGR